jgi:HNH endonuclease
MITKSLIMSQTLRCLSDNAHLIPSKERSKKFDYVGRHNIWYGDTPDGETVKSEIKKFISSYLERDKTEKKFLDLIKNGKLSATNFDENFEDIERDFAEIQSSDLPLEKKLRLAEARIGQGKFRKNLEFVWNNACAVTGCTARRALRASHIKPWAKCENVSERLTEDNGILLSANLDALFDAGLIGFDDRGVMLISDQVSIVDRRILGLGGNLKKIPNPYQAKYLAYHLEHEWKK